MHNDRAVNILLRMEGLAFALIGLWLYTFSGLSWWWFALFILAPDLSMAGYLLGPKAGAAIYNAVHTWVAPIVLGAIGWFSDTGFLLALAFIWAVHIGVDRALGYGLKMESGFQDTHLGRIGRDDAPREA